MNDDKHAPERLSVSELSGTDLWQRAQTYRTMAQAATDPETRNDLFTFAWQFEELAREKRAG